MLPATARLTHRDDFATVVRRGRKVGRTLVVLHALLPGAPRPERQVGFVVSKAVGGSVVRHRVVRRLRHLMRDRLDQLPAGTQLVVRARPGSATANSAQLGAEVDSALRALRADPGRR